MAEIIAPKPTILTDAIKQRAEIVFALDGDVKEVAYYCGVSTRRMNIWLEANPEWKEHCEMLRQKPVLKARQAVVGHLDDPEFALKYLSKKKKDEFSDRTEMTGKNGEALVTGFNYVNPNATNPTDNPTDTQAAPSVGGSTQ